MQAAGFYAEMKLTMRRQILHTLTFLLVGALATSSCVSVDPETGETIPRGNQRYEFSEVTRNVDKLEIGMSYYQVLMLLGSPAEKSKQGDVWIYLPERAAVLIPGRALRLQFRNSALASYGYHAIVLGARL